MAEQTVNEAVNEPQEAEPTVNPANVEESPVEASQDAEMQEIIEDADDQGAQEGVNQGTDEITEFLQSKHIDPSDPEALRKVGDMYRNAELKMNQESQKRASLERQFSQPQALNPSDTEALARVRALEGRDMARDFIERNNVTPEVESKMTEYLEQPVSLPNGALVPRARLVLDGIISLDEVRQLVSGNTANAAEMAAQVRRQTLTEVANKSRGSAPKGNATHGDVFNTLTADNVEAWYAGLSTEERSDPNVQRKLDSLLQ